MIRRLKFHAVLGGGPLKGEYLGRNKCEGMQRQALDPGGPDSSPSEEESARHWETSSLESERTCKAGPQSFSTSGPNRATCGVFNVPKVPFCQ